MTGVSTAKSARTVIRKLQAALLRRIGRGVLLSHSDIAPLGALCEQDSMTVLLCRQESKNAKHSSPSLSFLIREGSISSFDSSTEVSSTEEWIRSGVNGARNIHHSRHYRLLGNLQGKHSDFVALGELLDLFYENSVIKVNIDRDRGLSLVDRIKLSISASKAEGLAIIPTLVRAHTSLDALVVRVQTGQLLVHVTKDGLQLAGLLTSLLAPKPESGLGDVAEHDWRVTLDGATEVEIRYPTAVRNLLTFHSRPTSPRGSLQPQWAAIADVIHFGKPQFFEISGNNSVDQIFVFPIVFGELLTKKKPTRPRFLLIVQAKSGIKKADLSAIELILHSYVHQRTVANRLQTLAEARRQIQSIPIESLSPDEISHTGLMSLFAQFGDWIARQTLEATPAHSMTVRLYDHASRSLIVAASANDADGSYQAVSAGMISVKEKRFISLNAFVFVNAAAAEFQHAYLPRVSSGNPTTDQIPGELQKLGLRSILNVRPNTQSEICLPLRYHRVPIGTINVEAPIPDVFDDHLDFLYAIRDYVEEAYEKTLGHNDVRSLSKQVAIHAAVHELDQYLDLSPPVFSGEQQAILKGLFNLRSIEENRLTDLRVWLLQWAQHAYANQSAETIEKIVNLVQVRSISPDRISAIQWSGIQFLLKNLVQNIVSHGSIEPGEGNSIVVDDRPLYGAGPRDFLRISSKQTAIRDQHILDRVCVAPILSRSGGARYGMLLIGMITKTLGGQVFMGRNHLAEFTECLIRMPYALTPPKESVK